MRVPGIHVEPLEPKPASGPRPRHLDGRDKPGHDGDATEEARHSEHRLVQRHHGALAGLDGTPQGRHVGRSFSMKKRAVTILAS